MLKEKEIEIEKFNPFAVAQAQLDEAAELLGLDPATHELLRWPLRELHVTLPVKMDDGSSRVFRGFGCSTTTRVGRRRGGCVFISMRPSIRSVRWRPG